jgi:hypothetical protein
VILIALAGSYLIVSDMVEWFRYRPPANLDLFIKACRGVGRSIEAQGGLRGIFTSAMAVYGEHKTYEISDIEQLGYRPSGSPRYSYWYAVNGKPTIIPGSSQAKTPCDLTTLPASVAASATGFTAVAKGMIDKDGACDEWSINEKGELKRESSIDWINPNTLLVSSHVTANCSDSIVKHGANYKIEGKKLILEYRVDKCRGMCAACDCDFGVTYRIKGLEKTNYEIELRRLN